MSGPEKQRRGERSPVSGGSGPIRAAQGQASGAPHFGPVTRDAGGHWRGVPPKPHPRLPCFGARVVRPDWPPSSPSPGVESGPASEMSAPVRSAAAPPSTRTTIPTRPRARRAGPRCGGGAWNASVLSALGQCLALWPSDPEPLAAWRVRSVSWGDAGWDWVTLKLLVVVGFLGT